MRSLTVVSYAIKDSPRRAIETGTKPIEFVRSDFLIIFKIVTL